LDAIYAAFTAGWDTAPLASQGGDLAEEAIWLGRMVVEQLPEAAEARGLLALMLHCHARRAARRDANGRFVPLDEQDPREWSLALILEAEQQLRTAASYRVIGHYQLEAAIQSAHAAGAARGKKDWAAITGLYQGLLRIAPSLGAEVAYCAALRHTEGPAGALARLLDLEESRVAGYQPYWALRGQLARDSGDVEGAAAAYRRALALTEDPAVRDFLQGALQEARDGGSH
jgi:RNA polymerase sigma-70 factor (ECF subfamily)